MIPNCFIPCSFFLFIWACLISGAYLVLEWVEPVSFDKGQGGWDYVPLNGWNVCSCTFILLFFLLYLIKKIWRHVQSGWSVDTVHGKARICLVIIVEHSMWPKYFRIRFSLKNSGCEMPCAAPQLISQIYIFFGKKVNIISWYCMILVPMKADN